MIDLSTAAPIAGSWVYSQTAGGSEASFLNASALPQLTIRCTRATRRVTISKPASRSGAVSHRLDQRADARSAGELQSRDAAPQYRGRGKRSVARRDCLQPRAIWSQRLRRSGRACRSGLGRTSACDRGLPRLKLLSRRSARRLPNVHRITSLAFHLAKTHIRLGFNAAKGGDPMSHGSAGRSERGVRPL